MFFSKNSIRALFLLPFFTFAQNQKNNLNIIDNLLVKAESAYKNLEDTKCLEYAKKASELSLKAADSKRQAESYFLMARVLATMEIQKESMMYVKKAEELGYGKNNIILQAELKEIKAFNYRSLGLNSQFTLEDKGIIDLLKNSLTVNSLMIQSRAYGNIGSHYYEIGKTDSAFVYLKKEEDLLKKIPENRVVSGISEFFDAKGYVFLKINQMDSAFYYFKKEYDFKKKYKDPLLYVQYCAFGDYYLANGENDKALEYFLKTVENIKEYDVRNTGYTEVYKNISELYGKLKQHDKETLYLKKYTRINDSINKLRESKIDHVTNIILKEKEQGIHHDKKNTIWFIIMVISIISASIFYFIYRKYAKAKKSNKKNRDIILQKENETKDLKLKLNESFEELIILAKTNHSNFYARFQEVYPDFQKKLLMINPDLQIPELTLSAYIYLDFQTKEIADYTFKSYRTIQNRKNRLRKKLNLGSSENLNVWFKNLIAV